MMMNNHENCDHLPDPVFGSCACIGYGSDVLPCPNGHEGCSVWVCCECGEIDESDCQFAYFQAHAGDEAQLIADGVMPVVIDIDDLRDFANEMNYLFGEN